MEHKSGLGDEPDSHSWKTLYSSFSIAPALLLKIVLCFMDVIKLVIKMNRG